MLRNKKIKRNWNGEDISLLVWTVSKRLELSHLTHFSEFVTTFLFSKKKTGNSFPHSSLAPAGKNANFDGSASRRSN
jgi:hypothetical protein